MHSIVFLGRIVGAAAACAACAADGPRDLRCEWRTNPAAVHDPSPEFSWEGAPAAPARLAVASSMDAFGAPLWEIDCTNGLTVVEYAGPPLRSGATYFWKLRVPGGSPEETPVQRFAFERRPMPHILPTARTFVNFAGDPDWARDRIDMCFRKDAKRGRAGILATQYALICTMVVPSPKADALLRFCLDRGADFEECFCHFAEDAEVTLHVGAESAKNPLEKRLCPGWDPRNDRNGDGAVDETEAAAPANPKATARQRRSARIPVYFWGPPRDDYVMNVACPAYREFMAAAHAPEVAEGFDGIYFDTVPPDVPGAGRRNAVLEFPRAQDGTRLWTRAVQALLAAIKRALPDKIVTANSWQAHPLVIDGFQSENWLNITTPSARWRRIIDEARATDRRGKIQMLQYNPVHDDRLAEFGPRVPGVDRARDQIYGLASYCMAHGDFTYFGFGSHPYARVTELWFDAIAADIGRPEGECFTFSETDRSAAGAQTNLLANGGFEAEGAWRFVPPFERAGGGGRAGGRAARIDSDSAQINNINSQRVALKPRTTYTLEAWIRAEGVAGSPGAQVYPYEFDGASGAGPQIEVSGTAGWTRHRQVFTTSDDAEGRISFRMYGATGTAWFDDIALLEGALTTETVFARRYSKGLVLVRPSNGAGFGGETARAFRLPSPRRPLCADGTAGASCAEIVLRNGEAAILLDP